MFITIEGIEGTGKSTVAKRLLQDLMASGKNVIMTREPGGTPVAEAIRQVLLAHWQDDPMADDVELMLMFASRMQHVQNLVKPALAAGKIVISDRFHDASFAYQGGGRGLSMQRIQYLSDWVLQGFKPDVTFLLDADPKMTFKRLQGDKDRIELEQLDFFQNIREAYLVLAAQEPERIVRIEADQPFENVMQQIKAILDRRMEQRHV